MPLDEQQAWTEVGNSGNNARKVLVGEGASKNDPNSVRCHPDLIDLNVLWGHDSVERWVFCDPIDHLIQHSLKPIVISAIRFVYIAWEQRLSQSCQRML
ncbi:Hypothetical predicted protein [Xyrichtys novacula]|uniref:Uncharacterized protein n=1 Tax=Xyrichtys novacula TaxID=13765 RepID=A0AAV1F9G1_XYRNO|nr:Hypothetical predicted protein [Xyrichtys novacula]